MKLIVARDREQGELHGQALGVSSRVIGTQLDRVPPGMYPLPEDVIYTPGWELGRNAQRVLVELQRAYRWRIAA